MINLTPADLRKEGPSFDLPISVGIMAASEQVRLNCWETICFRRSFPDGSLRPVAGVLSIAAAAHNLALRVAAI